jgi:hypothetical protein
MLSAGSMEYSHNDKDLTARMSAVEANRSNDKGQLDHIQSQGDRLVEWAIDGKGRTR